MAPSAGLLTPSSPFFIYSSSSPTLGSRGQKRGLEASPPTIAKRARNDETARNNKRTVSAPRAPLTVSIPFRFRLGQSDFCGGIHMIATWNYRTSILAAYGIKIRDAPRCFDPNTHFHTKPLHGNFAVLQAEDGQAVAWGLEEVFIHHGNVVRFVHNYASQIDCEHVSHQTRLADLYEMFARRAGFGVPGRNQGWRLRPAIERRLNTRIASPNTGFASNPSNAVSPPVVNPSCSDSGSVHPLVDMQAPACVYWIQTLGFGYNWTKDIHATGATLSLDDRITCPYLTVEFELEGENPCGAAHRVAKHASIALYNRFLLRKKVLDLEQGVPHEAVNLRGLQHYGITFSTTRYRVWIAETDNKMAARMRESQDVGKGELSAGDTMEWTGCTLYELTSGVLTDVASVHILANWINEIHRWAMYVHARSCREDIDRWSSSCFGQ